MYILNLEVEDHSCGPAVFLAFGETVEQIIGMRVRKLMDNSEEMAKENEADNVPKTPKM